MMAGCYFTGIICILTAIVSVQGSCEECKTCQGDTCYTCSQGYYLVNGNCVFCQPNCDNCFDATRCAECNIGFWSVANPGSCSSCAAGCYYCNSYTDCRVCRDGYYNDNGNCQRCPDKCLTCSSGIQCSSCVDGYWGSVCSETCSSKCKTNRCTSLTGSCEECNVGWWGSKCQYPCPTYCLNNICSQSETCTDGCQTGFYGISCTNECPAKCKTSECDLDGSCPSGCKAGYYGDTCEQKCIGTACVNDDCFQNNGTCMASCPDKCSSCSSMLACTVCKYGYYGPTCDSECSETNCLECDKITGVCSKCGSGFYWSGSLCLQCTIGCTECTNSGISSCSACSPGYYLDTSTCIKCPDGCISCAWSDKCNECIDGYFKVSNSGRCEKCLSSCKSCASAAQCTACVDGYYGCHYGCLVGFTGRTCSETLPSGKEPSNKGTIVGVVVGSIGCMALIVFVIAAVLILRRKQSLCQTSVSREDSNEQGNTENTDPTSSQYEDLRYRPANDMRYSHLCIDNNTGGKIANRSHYENVQESAVIETNTMSGRQYENVPESNVDETNTLGGRQYEKFVL